jgi:chromosomal replication initiator protein
LQLASIDNPVPQDFWSYCLSRLESELPSQQFSTWIKALKADREHASGQPSLRLFAPNRFVLQWVRERYLGRIGELAEEFHGAPIELEIVLPVAGVAPAPPAAAKGDERAHTAPSPTAEKPTPAPIRYDSIGTEADAIYEKTRLNPDFTFDTLVTGRANDLARAAAMQVSQNPGTSYNPLFIYGGVGLGKTHLVQAIGNAVYADNPRAVIRYVHVEDYYADVVRAYQQKSFDAFKRYYRSLDLLIIDDIQFFNNKNRTQEEFFHAFNALTEAKKQIIITCDTYPKDIQGLEDRLISRFDWGLTVQIEPPELEMRVAILKKKAEVLRVDLTDDVAFLIAKNLRSNVRELEGALNKVVATPAFTAVPFRWNWPRTRSRTCSTRTTASSPSSTSRKPSPTTTRSRSPTCTPRSAPASSRARARSRCGCPRSSPPCRCRPSATPLADATTPRCCTPAAPLPSCVWATRT